MGPDWIQSLWTRHHCTLDDPSYNQFRETLNLLRNEHDLEKGRNLALCAAKLILLAKKVNPIYSHSISSVRYNIMSHLLPIHDKTANFCAILIRPQVLLDRRMTIHVWETIRCQHKRLRTRSRCMWLPRRWALVWVCRMIDVSRWDWWGDILPIGRCVCPRCGPIGWISAARRRGQRYTHGARNYLTL